MVGRLPMTVSDTQRSLTAFDQTVAEIETSVVYERGGQLLTACWRANRVDQTCAACDFRTYCPRSPRRGRRWHRDKDFGGQKRRPRC
jgi:Ni/Co efflux regulator RcnB